ncbi:phosphotransferase family protein [Pseudonocardia nematodicida]|uniref:Phosphotransferase family protein n=1 Tax=Pseudonocardia nematodicida TaxID=1206997 RepID=A0ABV1K5X2_9PSEU
MSAPALDLAAVRCRLAEAGVGSAGELTADRIAGGRSNQTFVLRDGGDPRWVLRCPPFAGRTPSAHDVAREFRVTTALHGTGVPVAAPVLLCEDDDVLGVPFTVVEYVAGRTVRTAADLAELSDADLDRCVDELLARLAALHAVDPDAAGLAGFGRRDAYAARQLRRWSAQWVHVGTSAPAATAELERRLREQLSRHVPDQDTVSVVHGDFRIDNTLLDPSDPGIVRAVVDWELSTIGDPVADVAMMRVYRHPALDLIVGERAAWTSDRLPGSEELLARYEEQAGVRLRGNDFHLALGYYKLAVIAQGIHHRHLSGATSGDEFATAGDAVADLFRSGMGVFG